MWELEFSFGVATSMSQKSPWKAMSDMIAIGRRLSSDEASDLENMLGLGSCEPTVSAKLIGYYAGRQDEGSPSEGRLKREAQMRLCETILTISKPSELTSGDSLTAMGILHQLDFDLVEPFYMNCIHLVTPSDSAHLSWKECLANRYLKEAIANQGPMARTYGLQGYAIFDQLLVELRCSSKPTRISPSSEAMLLQPMVRCLLIADSLELANSLARSLLNLADRMDEVEHNMTGITYSGCQHHAHTTLGIVAWKQGYQADALFHLTESSRFDDSLELWVFPPRLDLLQAVISTSSEHPLDEVLEYLRALGRSWPSRRDVVDLALQDISRGEKWSVWLTAVDANY